MRTAIYIRVSTEEQAKEGYSISAQKQKLKAYCIAQDWDVCGFYVDEGISAKDMKRPQLQQLINDIKEGKVDCVLVYRLDRLTRSVLDLYKMLQTFEKYDCKFKSATEVFETTTAIGRMFITIVAAMAQWERENLGERVRMGMAEKLRQGKYVHNKSPYGYDLDLVSGTLTIKEEEAKVVRLIVDKYLNGYGANKICKYLNERQIRTKAGNVWSDNPLIQLLKNPIYSGTIKWGDEVSEDAVPAIIDKKTYQDIQTTLENRRSMPPHRISSNYIFSGALKCQNCGHSMVGYNVNGTLANGDKIKYKNYRCVRKKIGECTGSKGISEIALNQSFIQYLSELDFTLVLDEVSVDAEKEMNNIELDAKEDLLKDMEKVEKRKKKWQYAWSNDMISDDDFRDRMKEERFLEEEIKEKLEVFQYDEVVTPHRNDIISVLKDIRKNWETLNDLEKKNLIQLTVKQIHPKHDSKNKIFIDKIDFY